MRTPDAISKKKQKLAKEIDIWSQREYMLMSTILLTNLPEAEDIKKKIDFCRQEGTKCKEALNKLVLTSWTPKQILAGWK